MEEREKLAHNKDMYGKRFRCSKVCNSIDCLHREYKNDAEQKREKKIENANERHVGRKREIEAVRECSKCRQVLLCAVAT